MTDIVVTGIDDAYTKLHNAVHSQEAITKFLITVENYRAMRCDPRVLNFLSSPSHLKTALMGIPLEITK